ncbi:MAG: serine/threonine protein kinase [Deltaproteobacteria bacterium]|nr:serine/threonine protein kinase [Deltaproteobacteria bacterium]
MLDGRYRIDSLIGTGGIGAVYRGTHLTLGKPVAIKLLKPEFAQVPEFLARFDREARALSRLSHVNIVSVTDFGVANGFPYLVMELLEGSSLEAEIDAGRVDLERGLAIGRQILATLEYAHGQGVVHRDLKPQNVMLIDQPGMRDLVKILDFGLAKIVTDEQVAGGGGRGDPTLTRHGTIFGTPAYMSPEQAAGDAADARSDVYSAGVILFELMTGRVPFLSEVPAELIRHHITTRPPRMADVAPEAGISENLERVVARAMHKDRGGRYQTSADLLEALTEAVALGARAKDSSPSSSQETKKYPSLASRPTGTDRTLPATPAIVAGTRLVRQRKGLILGASLVVVVLGAVAVVLRIAGSDPVAPGLEGPGPSPATSSARTRPRHPAVDPSGATGTSTGRPSRPPARDPWLGEDLPPELVRALLLVDNDKFEESEGYAKLWVKRHRSDPRAHLVLGHGYCGRGWRRDGLWRYKLALRIDESVRGDPRLLENLVAGLADERVGQGADQMIRSVYGAEAVGGLLAATVSSRTLGGAHRAIRILEDLGHGGEIDRVAVALADLARARRCQDRQAAMSIVGGAADDPRVRSALETLRRDPAVARCLAAEVGETNDGL